MILYKLRITEQNCSELSAQISAAQRDGDAALLKSLVDQLSLLNKVKLQFSKELKRL